MSRQQEYIQEGTKCYVKTRHSNMELLCTVIMLDNYNVKVRLPCKVNGCDVDVVNIKDIRVLPPEKPARAYQPDAYIPRGTNPFRLLVERLKVTEEPVIPEPLAPPEPDKPATLNSAYTGLSADESEFLEGLTENERKAYMELLK